MLETMRNAWRIPELRKKMTYTLFMIFLFRLGSSIPVPGINLELLDLFFQSASNTMFGFIDVFTGGGLSQATLFAMSITPYINASIIIQLLTIAIPALERLAKEGGEEGKKTIGKITRYLATVIGLIQAYSFYIFLSMSGLLQTDSTAFDAFVIVLTFTAGTAIVMWLGENITKKGIGNGTSMILFAGIISRVPSMVMSMYNLVASGSVHVVIMIIIAILALALVVFVVFMNAAERRIPIQYAKRVVGRKMYGGQSTHLPIKVSASGVMPIIFASSLLSLPSTIGMFLVPEEGSFWSSFLDVMAQTSPVYIILYLLLILGFSYFYSAVQFNPIEIANNLKKNGGFIPGFRPGRPTSEFITKVLAKITFMGAVFLGVVATLPLIVGAVSPTLSGVALGGTSLLIVVGVALDTVKQLESQMMMRHYKGFLE